MPIRDIWERIGNVRENIFDTKQNEAVDAIKDTWDSEGEDVFIFPVVDGPPGTGKTTVGVTACAEYMLEHPNEQVIYLCYTHFAADVAQQAFIKYGFSPDQVVRLMPGEGEVDWSRGVVYCDSDLSNLSDETVRRLQRRVALLCTLHGSKRVFRVRGKGFEAGGRVRRVIRLIVDEFSQVAPPLWFSCLQHAKDEDVTPTAYALLGDPYQLPIVTTQPMLQENIGEFVVRESGIDTHRLEVQHRMHEDICEAVNQLRDALNCPYRLKSGKEVKHRDLTNLGFEWDENGCPPELREILDPNNPLVIVDTSKFREEQSCFGGSLKNDDEAEYAVRIAMALNNSCRRNGRSLTPSDVKILSPYSGQVGVIQQLLEREWLNREFCTTIYRSQGREYPCVIISSVRNNRRNFIGFLQDPKLRAQVYVGCSRAQGKLIILLSHECFEGHKDFDYLCQTRSAHFVEVSR